MICLCRSCTGHAGILSYAACALHDLCVSNCMFGGNNSIILRIHQSPSIPKIRRIVSLIGRLCAARQSWVPPYCVYCVGFAAGWLCCITPWYCGCLQTFRRSLTLNTWCAGLCDCWRQTPVVIVEAFQLDAGANSMCLASQSTTMTSGMRARVFTLLLVVDMMWICPNKGDRFATAALINRRPENGHHNSSGCGG